ncbi:SBBP repeat-containing protein [Flexithrix dorotheae]|uniref:SBBP repeat-containing protein n=1 Tax=Flexithrix dorotheae TaxID=70993 RepID=UPI000375AF27|nr:SBBP repeat-containing protein [Flexithrix dorotheae]
MKLKKYNLVIFKASDYFNTKTAGFLILFLFQVNIALAQYTTEWVRYPAGESNEYSKLVAVDIKNQTYIAGYYYSDTIKFSEDVYLINPDKEETYANKKNGFIAKYNQAGNIEWVKTFSGKYATEVIDMALDSKGDIYLTGIFTGDAFDFDNQIKLSGEPSLPSSNRNIFLLKLNSLGNVEWHKIIYGESNEYVNVLEISDHDNIFISGYFSSRQLNIGGEKILKQTVYTSGFIAKFDSDGKLTWTNEVNSASPMNAFYIAVDSDENVYWGGNKVGEDLYFNGKLQYENLNPYGFFLSEIKPDGTLSWVKTFNGNNSIYLNGIEVDIAGDMVLAGHFYSDEIDFGNGIKAIKPTIIDNSDLFLAKLNSKGDIKWANTYGEYVSEQFYGIDIDDELNIYLSGSFEDSIKFGNTIELVKSNLGISLFVVKLNEDGEAQWGMRNSGSRAEDLKVDSQKNIFVTGNFKTNLTGFGEGVIKSNEDREIFLAKLQAPQNSVLIHPLEEGLKNGNILAGEQEVGFLGFSLKTEGSSELKEIIVDANRHLNTDLENIRLVNSADNSLSSQDDNSLVAANIKVSGKQIFITELKEELSAGKNYFFVADISDEIYEGTPDISFSLNHEGVTVSNGFVYPKTVNGEHYKFTNFVENENGYYPVIAKSFPNLGHQLGEAINVDPDGNIIIAGKFQNKELILSNTVRVENPNPVFTHYSIFVAKFDKYLNPLWVTAYSATETPTVKTDASGNIYLTGEIQHGEFKGIGEENFTDPPNRSRVFIAKLNPDGITQWVNYPTGNFGWVRKGLAVSQAGDVFVSGNFYSEVDFGDGIKLSEPIENDNYTVIAKLNSEGKPQWAKAVKGSSYDFLESIAIDSHNNVFLTGWYDSPELDFGDGKILTSVGGKDIFIAAYDNNGNLKWAKNAGSPKDDIGRSVTTDILGNVYVTGTIPYQTLTYNSMVIDFGNSVRLKYRTGMLGTRNMFVVKYNPNGEAQWMRAIFGDIKGNAIKTDQLGNLFVAGHSGVGKINFNNTIIKSPLGTSDVSFLLKYNKNGEENWATLFGGGDYDEIASIDLDPEGNIYSTGHFEGKALYVNDSLKLDNYSTYGSKKDLFFIKYAQEADNTSIKQIGDDIAQNPLSPKLKNPVLLGFTIFPNGSTKFENISIHANRPINGHLINFRLVSSTDQQYNTNGDNHEYILNSIISEKTLSFTGLDEIITENKSYFLIADVSEDVDENTEPIQFSFDKPDIALSSGLVQTQKIESIKYNFAEDIHLPSPKVTWAQPIISQASDFITKITTDREKFIYATGFFYSDTIKFTDSVYLTDNSQNSQLFIVKYHTDGNALWARKIIGEGTNFTKDIVTDGKGNIFVTGKFYGDFLDFGDGKVIQGNEKGSLFIAKYSFDGKIIWAKTTQGNSISEGESVCIDFQGNVSLLGKFKGAKLDWADGNILENSDPTESSSDIFIAQFTGDGNLVWQKSFKGEKADEVEAIKTDPNGFLYVTGSFESSTLEIEPNEFIHNPTQKQPFLLKLDDKGHLVWKKKIAGDSTNLHAMEVGSNGEIYLAGEFNEMIEFGDGIRLSYDSNDKVDAFVAKFDSEGKSLWAKAFAGDDYDHIYSISIDHLNDIYLAGSFVSKSLEIGNGISLESKGDFDIFLTKLTQEGQVNWVTSIGDKGWDNFPYTTVDHDLNVYLTGFYDSETLEIGDSISLIKQNIDESFIAKFGQPLLSINLSKVQNGIVKNLIQRENKNNAAVLGFSLKPTSTTTLNEIRFGLNREINAEFSLIRLIGSADDDFETQEDNQVISSNFIIEGNEIIFGGLEQKLLGSNNFFLVVDIKDDLDPRTPDIQFSLNEKNIKVSTGKVNPGKIQSKLYCLVNASEYHPVWARSARGKHFDAGERIIKDRQGNIYVAGTFASDSLVFTNEKFLLNAYRGSDFPTLEVFLAKYSPSGELLWIRSASGLDSESIIDLQLDEQENIRMEGASNSDQLDFGSSQVLTKVSDYDYFEAIYNKEGKIVSAEILDRNGQNPKASILFDDVGNRYEKGLFLEDSTVFGNNLVLKNPHEKAFNNSIYIVKYNAQNNPVWAKAIGGPLVGVTSSFGIDALGNILIAGNFHSGTLNLGNSKVLTNHKRDYDVFLTKIDSQGETLWAKSFEGDGSNYCNYLLLDAQDNIWLTGEFFGEFLKIDENNILEKDENYDVFLAKLNADGEALWAKSYGGNSKESRGYGIFADDEKNIYLTGGFENHTLDFGDSVMLHASGKEWIDVFVVKFSPKKSLNNAPILLKEQDTLSLPVGFAQSQLNLSEFFEDIDGDSIQYKVNLSDSLIVDWVIENGELKIIEKKPGSTTITITAEDPYGGLSILSFQLYVKAVNKAPLLSKPIENQYFEEGFKRKRIDLNEYFFDPDGDTLSFELQSLNTSVVNAIDSLSFGLLLERGIGETGISVIASDPQGDTISTLFYLIVNPILGFQDDKLSQLVHLYPNPVETKFTVYSKLFKKDYPSFQCFNAVGKQVNFKFMTSDGLNYHFKFEQLPKGVYSLIIEINGEYLIKQWVK